MPAAATSRGTVHAALVFVQVSFGVNYLASKIVLTQIEPRAWASIRVVTATIILVGAARLLKRRLPRSPRDWLELAFLSIFGVLINQVLFVEGLSRTTPTHSAVIVTTIPVGTLLFAVLLRHETMRKRKGAAIALAFVGALIVIRPGPDFFSDRASVGDLLTFLNALSFALFLVLSRKLLQRIDPLVATASLFAVGALFILAVSVPQVVAFRPLEVSALTWGLAAFAILGGTVAPYLVNYWALARVESSHVALFIYLQPLIAATLSTLILGERFGLNVVVGGALIFVGVFLASRVKSKT